MKSGIRRGLSFLLCVLMVSGVLLCVATIHPQAYYVDKIYDDAGNILMCEDSSVRLSFSTVRIISFNNWYVTKGDPSGISFGNHPANENYCTVYAEKSGYYTVEGKIGNPQDWYRKSFDIHVVPQYNIFAANHKLFSSMKVNQSIPLSKIFPNIGGDSWRATGIRVETSDVSVVGFTSDNNLVALKKGTATLKVSTTRLNNQDYSTTYTVKVGSGSSSSSTANKNVTLATPALKKLENLSSGQRLSWGKVKGAAKYRVFIKKNGSWSKLADTTATSYINKKVSSGTKYAYTVRCVTSNGKTFTSNFNKTGKSAVFIAPPKVTKIENLSSGQRVSWGKVNGAVKYRLFIKKNGSWTKLADTTATSYTNKKVSSGTKYAYTVRCISSNGKSFTGAYNTSGKSSTFIGSPKITSFSNSSSGVTVKWGKVKGALKYRVFIKSGGTWEKLADTKSTSYLHKITDGKNHIYTVRCLNSNNGFSSAYNTTGWSHTAPKPPVIVPTSVSLNKKSASIDVGETMRLSETVLPANATNKTVTWSSNSSIVTVSAGTVTGKKPGTATITVKTSNGKTASCVVTVKQIQPKSVSLNKSSLSMKQGEAVTLTATVSPSDAADKTVTWSSSNTSVATVDKGKVTAKSPGYAYIFAKTSNGLSVSCYITVKSYFKANNIISEHIIYADNKNYYNVIDNSKVLSGSSSAANVQVQRYTLAKQPADRENTVYVGYDTKWSYIIDSFNNLYSCNTTGTTKIAGNVKSVFVSPGNFYGYISTSNDLYMWGNNYYGQIGVGDLNLNANGISTPTKVLSNVKAVSLGRSHAAAVLNNGDLYAWGSNSSGEIGNGTVNSAGVHSPTKIMSNIKAVSAGDDCTAAVTNSGILYTWGDNDYGQLGDKTYTDKNTPVKIMSGIKDIKMFDERVGALTESNQLYTWGNYNGQSTDYTKSPVPRVLANNIKAFYIGNSYSYYINSSSDIYIYSFQYANTISHAWYETFTPKKLSLCE